MERLLAGDAWRALAARAQEVYRRYLLEPDGHEEFAARVEDIVRAAEGRGSRSEEAQRSANLPR